VSGILRIVKGDKGTAGTIVAPAGEFKPRTSAKVRFEFAMNIYTEPAAPATETATDSTAPQAQSWRDTLPIHPAAALFPRMSSDALRESGKDIRKNGLRFPIALWQSDKGASALLLDGISRLDALEVELGRPVRVVQRTYRRRTRWSLETDEDGESVPVTDLIGGAGNTEQQTLILLGRDVDPWEYVASANLHRRHLTAEQRRELIVKLIEAMPKKSNRQIAKLVNASPTTVGTKRAEMEATGDVSKLDTSIDTRGRRQPVHKARATAPARLSERAVAVKTGVANLATEVTAAPSESSATVAARDDIGPDSAGEIARLNARVDELQAEKRQLEIKAVGLRSEIDELKAADEGAPKARTISELLATLLQLDTSMTTGEIDAIGATLKSDARARLREAALTLLEIAAAGEEA
jgi:DNA-binding Lrp family transcriptional regulator